MSGIQTREGGAYVSLRCFRCGGLTQCATDCKGASFWWGCIVSQTRRDDKFEIHVCQSSRDIRWSTFNLKVIINTFIFIRPSLNKNLQTPNIHHVHQSSYIEPQHSSIPRNNNREKSRKVEEEDFKKKRDKRTSTYLEV